MAILYAYCDESGKHSDHLTFAAVCISESRLRPFEDAWQILLRRYGIDALHMAIASRLSRKVCDLMPARQTPDERMDALMPFADCINEHFEHGLIQAMDVHAFHSMSKHARAQLGNTEDPYYIAFTRGLLQLVHYVHADDKVSIICDDDIETAGDCYGHYRAVRTVHDQVRSKTVSLTFADDKYFPAIQAADMVAFLSRLESKWRFYGDRYSFRRLYLKLTTDRGIGFTKWGASFADKDIIQSLSDALERRPKAKKGETDVWAEIMATVKKSR